MNPMLRKLLLVITLIGGVSLLVTGLLFCVGVLVPPIQRNDLVGVYSDLGLANIRNMVLYSNGTYCCEVLLPGNTWGVLTNAWRFHPEHTPTVGFQDFPGAEGGLVKGHNWNSCPVTKQFGKAEIFMGEWNSCEIRFRRANDDLTLEGVVNTALPYMFLALFGVSGWIVFGVSSLKKRQ